MIRLALLFVGLSACTGLAVEPLPAQPRTAPPKPERCVVRRAAYDIGSSTTKMKVAEIDQCAGRILRVLVAEDAPVFYRDDIKAPPMRFQRVTMDRGMEVLRRMQARAAEHGPETSAAVATAAFRRAENASEMTARIEGQLGIPVSVITQAQEARLGFVGAVNHAEVDPRNAVVWDVGGGSMQITTLRDDGHLLIYQGNFASGQMRDFVILKVQAQAPEVASPNPVAPQDASEACDFAAEYAATNVPETLRSKLSAKDTVVVGIGALKYYGDAPASEHGASCTMTGLEARIDDLVGKSDAEIGGAYAANAVSDRLLLLGFMRGLKISNVVLADVDLTDGLLFEAEYWEAPVTQPVAESPAPSRFITSR